MTFTANSPGESEKKVLFLPDWRSGITYQGDLALALEKLGVSVVFPGGTRRGLPLFRTARDMSPDLLHLHWPEVYFWNKPQTPRIFRYFLDLRLAAARAPLALTAHNLLPHDQAHQFGVYRAIEQTVRLSRVVFFHSRRAGEVYQETFGMAPEKAAVIPFGDLSHTVGLPVPAGEAQKALNLPIGEPFCLMFGTISPYKGVEDAITAWKATAPALKLIVVGPPSNAAYGAEIAALAAGAAQVEVRLTPWLQPADLNQWLSAAHAVLCNHRAIFSSGVACLARSFGLPVLLPSRHDTIDLGEPHPLVFRFGNLREELAELSAKALKVSPDYASAAAWREATSWDRVADLTLAAYRRLWQNQ